jgi:hypothetical protein
MTGIAKSIIGPAEGCIRQLSHERRSRKIDARMRAKLDDESGEFHACRQ